MDTRYVPFIGGDERAYYNVCLAHMFYFAYWNSVIAVMIYQLRAAKMSWMNPRMIGLLGFYGLNLYWYRKIIRIITEGKLRGDEAEDDHKEKKD